MDAYILVLATASSGWLLSFGGWTISYFFLFLFLMLASGNAAAVKTIDGLHQAAKWTLLVFIGLHVPAAFAHLFNYRDRVMERMLPG